jgi:hypothetical protein
VLFTDAAVLGVAEEALANVCVWKYVSCNVCNGDDMDDDAWQNEVLAVVAEVLSARTRMAVPIMQKVKHLQNSA